MKLGEWSRQWQDVAGRGCVGTVVHNEQMVRGFVREFGGRRLDQLTAIECMAWARQHGGSVRYVRLMLADAVRAGLLECNPMVGARRPVSDGRSRVDPPALGVLLRMRERAPVVLGEWGVTFGRMLVFSAFSGLRLNEAARLEARDVQRVPDVRVRVRFPKRPGLPRTVGVFAAGEAALLEGVPDVGLVFPSRAGRVLRRDYVSRSLAELCGDAGVVFTWHQLRHFCATWLLDQGASSEDVALQLGHSDGGLLVRRTYGHPSTECAVERLRRLAG